MKTRYVVTTTNPDELDPEDFVDSIENCLLYTALGKAKAGLKDFAARTNADVYLLKVELVDSAAGEL